MPNSTDNQDFTDNTPPSGKNKKPVKENKDHRNLKKSGQEDENNFTSDNQKGKKVDGDPTQESDQPANV